MSETDGVISGLAQAMVREELWVLSLLTVSPTRGQGGEGRALVNASLDYGRETTDRAIIVASNHPGALRLYASSGFSVEPTFEATLSGVALDAVLSTVDRVEFTDIAGVVGNGNGNGRDRPSPGPQPGYGA